ncbi:MAG: hypothetical protein IJY01_07210 [Clostridia bacterium]|nr:hypothetical protein [Clostridia bacterium]
MKRIISLLILLCCLLALVACDSASSTPTKPSTPSKQPITEQVPEKTAYEKLSEDEKFIFDALKINFKTFFVLPSSVKILSVKSGLTSDWDDNGKTTIPKTAKNSNTPGASVYLEMSYKTPSGETKTGLFSLQLVNGTGSYNTLVNQRGYIYEGDMKKLEATFGSFLDEWMYTLNYISVARLNAALTDYCK